MPSKEIDKKQDIQVAAALAHECLSCPVGLSVLWHHQKMCATAISFVSPCSSVFHHLLEHEWCFSFFFLKFFGLIRGTTSLFPVVTCLKKYIFLDLALLEALENEAEYSRPQYNLLSHLECIFSRKIFELIDEINRK